MLYLPSTHIYPTTGRAFLLSELPSMSLGFLIFLVSIFRNLWHCDTFYAKLGFWVL